MCPPAAAWQQGWATPGPLLLLGDELSFCSHSYLRSFPRRMMIDKRQLPPKLTSGESRERRGAKDPCYEMLDNVSPDFIPLKYARRWLLWIMPGGAPQDMTECDDGTMVPSPSSDTCDRGENWRRTWPRIQSPTTHSIVPSATKLSTSQVFNTPRVNVKLNKAYKALCWTDAVQSSA